MPRRSSLITVLFSASFLSLIVGCGGSKPDDVLRPPPTNITEADAGPPPALQSIIRVTKAGMLETTEAGGRVTFTVTLSAKPASEVVIPITSPTPTEVKVESSGLTFGPNDWDQPKTVTLVGQNEDVDDGDQKVLIGVGPTTSSDAAWNGVKTDAVEVLNRDDDVAGIEVSTPTPSNNTTESGTKVTFTVRLKSRPSAPVTIGLTSSVPTEGQADKTQLVFGPDDWMNAQTVTVTGQNDALADLDKAYDINLARPLTVDDAYAALSASKVSLMNLDDDTPGFFVFPPALANRFTTEAGGATSFTVRLRSKPTANVTVPISSSKPGEGSLGGVTQLVFTPTDFDQPQTVTVTGVEDKVDDGDQAYTIALGAATSTDGDYQGKDPPDVDLTNKDDDTAAILVSAPSASVTSETGTFVTFTVKLASEPTAPVTLSVVSSKPGEGAVDKAQLVFDNTNWNVAQTVTVTGQDEKVDDGDQDYTILITHKTGSVTTDTKYAAIEPSDVALKNSDNDTQGVTVSGPRGGTHTTEGGAFVFIDVLLKTQPTGDVTIPVSVSNGEAMVSTTLLTFTVDNWNTPQEIKVTGKNDDIDDGDQDFTVILGTATGGGYNVNPDDMTLSNWDDDTAGIVQSSSLTGALTEVGGQVTFNVHLASRPAGANTVTVPITITSGTATRSPTSLTFNTSATGTAGSWQDDQEVTVTGTGDLVRLTSQAVTIAVGAATSGDPKYSGVSAAGYASVANTLSCGIGGVQATEGEECDDGNATKCDGCELCLKENVAVLAAGSFITASSGAVTAAGLSMCIEAWAKVGTTNANDGIVAASMASDTDVNFALRCESDGRLSFGSETALEKLYAEQLATTCADGAWHHVVGCREEALGVITYRVFLDGAFTDSAPGTVAAIGAVSTLSFGPATSAGTSGLDGAIDEVHLTKAVRTTGYTVFRRATVDDTNTVGLWRFDEGTGTTAASAPANTYPATLSTAAWAADTGYTAGMCL